MSSAAYITDVSKSKQCWPNQTVPDLDPLCLHSIQHKSILSAQYLQHKGPESDNNLAQRVLIIV